MTAMSLMSILVYLSNNLQQPTFNILHKACNCASFSRFFLQAQQLTYKFITLRTSGHHSFIKKKIKIKRALGRIVHPL